MWIDILRGFGIDILRGLGDRHFQGAVAESSVEDTDVTKQFEKNAPSMVMFGNMAQA